MVRRASVLVAMRCAILAHYPKGEVGWPGRSPDGKDRSCAEAPMRIWLEENGTIYKSQTKGDDKIFISKVGYPPGDPDKATDILISYTNHKQFGMFGQVVWSLSMPDKDHFMWSDVPLGMPMPKLVRCDETAGKQIG